MIERRREPDRALVLLIAFPDASHRKARLMHGPRLEVWKRILAAADDRVALGIALSEEQARDIALAIARDEGIEPSEEILAYHAYALARRTQR